MSPVFGSHGNWSSITTSYHWPYSQNRKWNIPLRKRNGNISHHNLSRSADNKVHTSIIIIKWLIWWNRTFTQIRLKCEWISSSNEPTITLQYLTWSKESVQVMFYRVHLDRDRHIWNRRLRTVDRRISPNEKNNVQDARKSDTSTFGLRHTISRTYRPDSIMYFPEG